MLAVGLSLTACLVWGAADYLGEIKSEVKSRQLLVVSVLFISTFFERRLK